MYKIVSGNIGKLVKKALVSIPPNQGPGRSQPAGPSELLVSD
jgi:hypothetical protein